MPAGVLFVHNNFPAQFEDLARVLLARGTPCAAIAGGAAPGLPGMVIGRYALPRGTTKDIFPLAVRAEADLIRASAALGIARSLQERGVDPAVIVGHPGWGETVFLRQVWPEAKLIAYGEFFYHGHGLDVGFDDTLGVTGEDARLRAEAKNAVMSFAYAQADAIVAPTAFQASTLPPAFRAMTRIIHEGVDVDAIRPMEPQPLVLPSGRTIRPGARVITHINNNLEPLRGLHIFARALPRLMAEIPDAEVLIFGESHPRPYGAQAAEGRTWRDVAFDGLDLDPERLTFMGKTPHETMLAALQLSTAHVYYTYPFVLSWSLVEAMACGAYIIGSDTPPLHDAIEDGVSGRLLPFFDADALSQAMIDACRKPAASGPLRAAARRAAVERFSREAGREAWISLLRELGVEIPAAA